MVRRRDVGKLVEEVLQKVSRESIINAFRACGLSPLNPNAVDYTKCLDVEYTDDEGEQSPATRENSCTSEEYAVALKVIKEELGSIKSNFCYHKVNLHVNDIYAVSYTHLTLPTNREV